MVQTNIQKKVVSNLKNGGSLDHILKIWCRKLGLFGGREEIVT
jgi:hypothetical protein